MSEARAEAEAETGLQADAEFRFACCDCRVAVQFPRHAEGGTADAHAEYWDAIAALREAGWRVSARYGTKCPECKRKADTGLLNKPLKRSVRG